MSPVVTVSSILSAGFIVISSHCSFPSTSHTISSTHQNSTISTADALLSAHCCGQQPVRPTRSMNGRYPGVVLAALQRRRGTQI
ncbi:hypothetical protein FA95DRAFT_1196845 [Auriscalpium vulgare]|uniref:Uncharacterized protein n=1 Tax=Auriscalpium vulgare TaxID=40419 RepID=A0ACB8RUI3_9AGAM|nr:hypothetical protein FA95DRAFT_1196845 [Auriscalpium vulgare]